MEHSPNVQPMDRRKWVGFEAFDKLIAEALDDLPPPTSLLEPAQPDNVVDLGANVVELRPPDDAA